MYKIEMIGNILQIDKNTYPSGCCLARVKLETKLFDGTMQLLSVNFFNNDDIKLADIVSQKYQIGDKIKIIAALKPVQYKKITSFTVWNTVQFMAKNVMKL